jgi:hypothetical protein
MMVPSRSVRNVTRLYFIVWKLVPTIGPSSLLAFSGERTAKDKEVNSKVRTRIALEDVHPHCPPNGEPDQEFGKPQALPK